MRTLHLSLICVLTLSTVSAQSALDKAWAKLNLASGDKSATKRARAIQALALAGPDGKAIALAESALHDEDEDVRAAGATALGQMGARSSAPKLREAIKDNSAAVVFSAANALYLLQDPGAYEVYYAVLAGEKKSGESLMESQMKMIKDPKALAKISLEAGIGFVPFGGVSYKAYQMITKDDVSPVRAAAAAKLSRDPDAKSLALLQSSTSDKKWLVRAAAIDALAKRGDPAALPAIASALDDDNDIVQFTASAAVIRLSAVAAR